jgi:hypothetical protein
MGALLESFRRQREIDAVWAKGIPVPYFDPAMWRRDSLGALMKRSDYGDCSKVFGWEIDHVWPTSLLGIDTLDNKQPLQWQNNRSKSDKGLSGLYGSVLL